LIDIFEHGHVSVCEYVEFKCAYSAKEGASTRRVFGTLISELYKRRIITDMEKIMMDILVDIR
jgi:hypothetical protein